MMAHELSGEPRVGAGSTVGSGLHLHELVQWLAPVRGRLVGDGSVIARGLHQDSRKVERGDVFLARMGSRSDGTQFVSSAVRRGAVAVLLERGSAIPASSVPVIEVSDIRLGGALAAEALYGFPSRALNVVGITGTNGKTTSAWLAAEALEAAGARPGKLGTLGFFFKREELESALTTPESDEVARAMANVRARGGTHFVMEVSSHALAQARVDAVRFSVAAFTNLTQDHLDYHESMDAYGAAKERLFAELAPGRAVVNVDDAFGTQLAERGGASVLRVSRNQASDVCCERVAVSARGISATVRLPSGSVELESPLVGAHNLDNLLLALAIVEASGLDVRAAARGLAHVHAVPGRLERCDLPCDDVTVLVDYAHTPDALERVLTAARTLTRDRVLCVFGCGGDRDATKRPKMGEVVARLADFVVVTSDNPRSERPERIAADIEPGVREHATPFEVELDRKAAIERAVLEAEPGDVVLIAGKGHEPYQIVGADVRRFDDRVEARRALALRRERLGR
ncbi:MAG TPA: UDP-N-acetylmuramoyl-L-alanyl-D-glutamate--2,6-diaminopimelate ligase [Polyangiaceae bacterium]